MNDALSASYNFIKTIKKLFVLFFFRYHDVKFLSPTENKRFFPKAQQRKRKLKGSLITS